MIKKKSKKKSKTKNLIPGGKISGATTYRVIPDIAL